MKREIFCIKTEMILTINEKLIIKAQSYVVMRNGLDYNVQRTIIFTDIYGNVLQKF